MTEDELENCWKDPRNRKWGVFYYCKADPRVIVPKRLKWMGWTVNAARPSAIPVLLCLVALLVVPAMLVTANGGGTVVTLLTVAASVGFVCLLSAHLSSTKRAATRSI
jgi:hypothetical protein